MQKLTKAALLTVFVALLCMMNVQAKPGDEENAIVEKCKAIWSEGKLDMMAEVYSADVVRHSPGFGKDLVGLETFKEWITSVRTIYPDFAVEIGEVLAMGDPIAHVQ